MYPLNPFQPVNGIVDDLVEMVALKGVPDAGLAMSRSLVNAVREERADAVLRLALAYCVWQEARIDHAVMADMVETMVACGPQNASRNG